MIDRRSQRSTLSLAAMIVVSVVVAGCGGGASFTTEEASALILAQFPDSELQMRGVSINEEGRGVASALFNDAEWSFYFQPVDESWVLDAVETDGSFYYLKDLEQISLTIAEMSGFASSLERYKATNGTYPVGEDASALQVLIPDFAAADIRFDDAWEGALTYDSDGNDYTLISNGADKIAGNSDDIILHSGEFVGAGSGAGA